MAQGFSKRQFLIGSGGVAAAALATRPVGAQELEAAELSPEVAGQIHNRMVLNARETIVEDDPLSQSSFGRLLDSLVEAGLLRGSDADLLKGLVDTILSASDTGELFDAIVELIEAVIGEVSRLTATVMTIARDTVSLAREILSGQERSFVIRAIAMDVRGALDGASAGGFLGSVVPGLGTITGAVFGAIAGAGTNSIIGYFDETA